LRTSLQILVKNIVVPCSGIDAGPFGINDKSVREPRGWIEDGKLQSSFGEIFEPVLGTHRFVKYAFSTNSRRMKVVTARQQASWNNRFGASPGLFKVADQLFSLLHDVTVGVDVAF